MIETVDHNTAWGILQKGANAIEATTTTDAMVDGILIGLDITMKALKVAGWGTLLKELPGERAEVAHALRLFAGGLLPDDSIRGLV